MRRSVKRLRAYQFAAIAGGSLALLYWGKLRLVGGIPRTVNAEDGHSQADAPPPAPPPHEDPVHGAAPRDPGNRVAGADEPGADAGSGPR